MLARTVSFNQLIWDSTNKNEKKEIDDRNQFKQFQKEVEGYF